jgi:hypothetical protein
MLNHCFAEMLNGNSARRKARVPLLARELHTAWCYMQERLVGPCFLHGITRRLHDTSGYRKEQALTESAMLDNLGAALEATRRN